MFSTNWHEMLHKKKSEMVLSYREIMLLVILVFYSGSDVSGQENVPVPLQVKVGDTANFTWSYAKYQKVGASLEKIILGRYESNNLDTMSVVIGRKDGSGDELISPKLDSAFKARISFVVNTNTKTTSFYLKSIQESDDGKIYGVDMLITKLYKLLKRIEIVELPKFVSKPFDVLEVNEGDVVTLTCQASGKPVPEIQWKVKDSGEILQSGSGSASLKFSAKKSDSREYQCVAANVVGKISRSASVIVYYLPVIDVEKSSKTSYSFVGNPNPVTLRCFAEGGPTPKYFWQNNFGLNKSQEATYSLVNPVSAELDVFYTCFAWNKVGRSKPHSVEVKKLDEPGKVDVKILKVTSQSISVQWTLPNDTGGAILVDVIVNITDSAGSWKRSSYKPEITNATFEKLKPYSDYELEFIARNQVLESLPIKFKQKTSEAAPSAPINLLPGEASQERQLTVHWSPPVDANGIIRNYQIAYDLKYSYDENTVLIKNVSSSATKAVLTGLRPYQDYSIKVRAVTVEPGPWTPRRTMKTTYEAPSAPRNVTVLIINPKLARLTWKAPEVINGPISTSEADIWIDNKGKWSYRNEKFIKNPQSRLWEIDVIPFSKYKLRVREAAGLNRKWGPYSELYYFETPEGVPSVPKDVKITHRTWNSISLSWQRPDQINGIMTHFLIFYENSTRRYSETVNVDIGNDTFRHQIFNLKLSTKYTFMVQAFTAAGGGERSDPVETATVAPVTAERKKEDDEISAGPIIGGIFSFLVILVLLIILILFIARKQRMQKKASNLDNGPFENSPSPERRLLSPYDEKVPDLVSTNGKMPVANQNSVEEKKAQTPTFISSRPIKVSELKEVCDQLHSSKDAELVHEFRSIKRETNLTSVISDRTENKCKNRYNNIVAFDHSRVILSYIENIPGSDYINANYIDSYEESKKYITTQGPVTASFNDFWRMVWEQNCQIIVMVTNLIEKCRIKCQKYWPTCDAEQYGSIKVHREEEIELADYVIRKFSVSMVSGKQKHEPRKVTQYQFTGWPDHGVPQYATGLLQFVRRIKTSVQYDAGPIIVHCSAGVGRSGTYITLDSMLDQMKKEGIVDIHGFVSHIRTQRNYMVQTEGQYAFIYDALLEAVICGETEVTVKDLPKRIEDLEQINPESNRTYLHEEFERLSYNLEENNIYEAGFLEVNANKNRFPDIVPIESSRLKLWPYPNVQGSDYINANFLDGYQQREAFILTQAPMENTVEDFWRMIWEYEVFSILMLTSPEESDSSHCFPYWPIDSEPANIGLLLVQIAAEEEKIGCVKREFRVTNSKNGETRVITHFMFYDWSFDSSPEDPTSVLEMITQLQKTQQMTGNGSIVVHCSDGCGRSGTICAIMFCIERLKLEGVVDVFQTVRLMRTQRPHVIRSPENYLFCYKAVKKFVDKFSDYANFK